MHHLLSKSINTNSCIDLQNAEILNSKTNQCFPYGFPFFVLTLNYSLMVLMSLDIQFRDGSLKIKTWNIFLKRQNYAKIGRPHT